LHVLNGTGTPEAAALASQAIFQDSTASTSDIGIQLTSGTSGECYIWFGDTGNSAIGYFHYSNVFDTLALFVNTAKVFTAQNDQQMVFEKAVSFVSEVDNGISGTSDTIDWTQGNKQKSTITEDVTYAFTAPDGASNLILKITQDGSGGNEVTWPATVLWPDSIVQQPSAAAASVSIASFYYDGTDYYGQIAGDFS
jgi:hypothetical protein